MQIRPLSDCLVLKRIRESQYSNGGIFLGDHEETDMTLKPVIYGEVIAVGPGKYNEDNERKSMWGIQVGDKLAFSPNGNHDFNIDGEDVVMIRRNSVIGLIQ